MKKIQLFLTSFLFLLSCMTLVTVQGDSLSTTVHYTVNPTVIYVDYDGTQTTQKVEAGKTLKEPGHKGKKGYTFVGWKNIVTGEFWDFSNTVEDHLTLVACYSQNETDRTGKVLLGSGTFSINIRIENGVSGVSIGTDKVKLMEMLIDDGSITPEEISQIAGGASMDIVLLVKDGASTVSDSSKAQMQSGANGYTIGQYLDISLYKKMTKNGKKIKNQQLYELSQAITINVVISDALINTDSSVQRTFCVIRNHEGTVEILDSSYDESAHTLTFQTNLFSDYAIAYKDVKKADQSNMTGANGAAKKNTAGTKKNVPKTADTSHVTEYGIVLILSAVMAVLIYTGKRKKEKS